MAPPFSHFYREDIFIFILFVIFAPKWFRYIFPE